MRLTLDIIKIIYFDRLIKVKNIDKINLNLNIIGLENNIISYISYLI